MSRPSNSARTFEMKILLVLDDDGRGYEIQEFKLRRDLLLALPPRWCADDIYQIIETWLDRARVGDVLDIMTARGGAGMIILAENRTVLKHGWKCEIPEHEED